MTPHPVSTPEGSSNVDDRYRINQGTDEISEAVFRVAVDYGIADRIAVDEQVAVVRALRAALASRSGPLRRSDILEAFERFNLRRPPNGYAKDVIARLERLDPARTAATS